MARQVRSIKGEMIDFDLFEVKQQIGEKPVSMDVENRERFVLSKRKRGSKRTVEKMLQEQQDNAANVRDAMERQDRAEEQEFEAKNRAKKPTAKKPTAKKPTAKKPSSRKTTSKRRIIKRTK